MSGWLPGAAREAKEEAMSVGEEEKRGEDPATNKRKRIREAIKERADWREKGEEEI